MTRSGRSRYSSHSRSPAYHSRRRSRSRSYDSYGNVENPGNNLYVTGLSSRVRRGDLEKHFSEEGEVVDVHLVTDPWTKESRGFGFVTMATVEDADRCIKYLDSSILEDRVITVEKARRRRGRTPTPGRYLGARADYDHRRSPTYSPYNRRGTYDDSPRYSSGRDRSSSPYYQRDWSYSPYDRRRDRSRSYSPYERRWDRSYSHYDRRRDRSYSPYHRRGYSRSKSPNYRYHRSRRHERSSLELRSHSRSLSASPHHPRRSYRSVSRSVSPPPRHGRRYRSPSASHRYRRRRSYSRSASPGAERSRRVYYRNQSPSPRRSSRRRSSRNVSADARRRGYSHESYSHESYSHSRSHSRSVSRTGCRSP